MRLAELPHGAEMLSILRERWPTLLTSVPVFLHGDFHPFNTLWRSNGVSGVVDWAEATIGPREYDVAHIRWEIALRFDLSSMERFLTAYEAETRQRVPWMPLWDLMQICPGTGPALLGLVLRAGGTDRR